MVIARLEKEDGRLLTVINLMARQFKTGSKGFHGQGQVVVDSKRHLMNFQMVENGSQEKK